jgi:hypothetical protein
VVFLPNFLGQLFVNVADADAGVDYYIARRAAMIKWRRKLIESPAPSFRLIRAPSISITSVANYSDPTLSC